MNDERMRSALDEWLRDTDPQPPDPNRTATQLMSRLSETRQRGRWLPFRVVHRGVETSMTADTIEYQPNPIPATNGRSQPIDGRTRFMFSPAKAVTAGALIFAIGGALLVTQPFDQSAGAPPGVEADLVAPVHVTGRFSYARGETLAEEDGALGYLESWGSDGGRVITNDTRLEGELTFRNMNRIFLVDGSEELAAAAAAACEADSDCDSADGVEVEGEIAFIASSIENERGSWHERPRIRHVGFPGAPDPGDAPDNRVVQIFDGDGEYAGLVAVLMFDSSFELIEFSGFIVDARTMPPLPENASAG